MAIPIIYSPESGREKDRSRQLDDNGLIAISEGSQGKVQARNDGKRRNCTEAESGHSRSHLYASSRSRSSLADQPLTQKARKGLMNGVWD